MPHALRYGDGRRIRARLISDSRQAGPAVPRRQNIETHRVKRKKIYWPIFLFLLALIWPCAFFIGPLRMSLYRIVLLVMILPCAGMLIAGKAGRIRIADIAMLLFSSWCVLSLIVNGKEFSIQSSGIVLIETLGPYLLARCYIRDADDFYNGIQLLFRIVAFLLPFAFFELISGQNIFRVLLAPICPMPFAEMPFAEMPSRFGLTRVRAVFDHAILFGMFTSSVFAPAYLVLGYQRGIFQRTLRTGIVGATSILSLSSGPIIALIAQALLLLWNSLLWTIKLRWKILIGFLVLLVGSIEAVANRSIPDIISSFLAFDQQSYWFRVLIWHYASASVQNYPLFGVGLEWARPDWMPPSIDCLWLFLAVRYGLPAPFLLLLALLSIFLAVAFRKGLDDRLTAYRTAFLICMTAFFLVAWTVHFWDATYVLFIFLMGSGVWMMNERPKERPALRL